MKESRKNGAVAGGAVKSKDRFASFSMRQSTDCVLMKIIHQLIMLLSD